MKAFIPIALFGILAIQSCNETDNFEIYEYEATIVGTGDACLSHVVNLKNISGDPRIKDGVVVTMGLQQQFSDKNSVFNKDYVGTRIAFSGILVEDYDYNCRFMGQEIPFIAVSYARLLENQEEGEDQRMINKSNTCCRSIPFMEPLNMTSMGMDPWTLGSIFRIGKLKEVIRHGRVPHYKSLVNFDCFLLRKGKQSNAITRHFGRKKLEV